jgi:phospholipase/lecithinase/hemolysin
MGIWKRFRFAASAWFAGLMILVAASPAGAATTYPAIYVFGDSLSDAGNVWTLAQRKEPLSPPYSQGRFSNGPVWAQDLARKLGFRVLKPSLQGGTDYAYGGAESGPTLVHTVEPLLDLPTQIAEFKVNVPHPSSGALFVLWIGANDLIDILGANLSSSDQNTAINDIMTNEEAFLTLLVANGGKHLMVVTIPDLGATPMFTSQGTAKAQAATALTQQFNAQMTSRMKFLAGLSGLDLTIVDTFTLIDSAVANPKQYGFNNVTTPCWTGSFTSLSGGTECALGAVAQDRHLFWDHLHPTARAHAAVADAAMTALGVSSGRGRAVGESLLN